MELGDCNLMWESYFFYATSLTVGTLYYKYCTVITNWWIAVVLQVSLKFTTFNNCLDILLPKLPKKSVWMKVASCVCVCVCHKHIFPLF